MTGKLTKKVCLLCGELARITTFDSRSNTSDHVLIRRRRKCHSCGETYTTHEVLADDKVQAPQEHVFRKVLAEAAASLYYAMTKGEEK